MVQKEPEINLIKYVCVKCDAPHWYPPGVDPDEKCQSNYTCQGKLIKEEDKKKDNNDDNNDNEDDGYYGDYDEEDYSIYRSF